MSENTPNCPDCWWADFDSDADGFHKVREEPDYAQMKHPDDTPPMYRVVSYCEKGQEYFKEFGNLRHTCPLFSPYEDHREESARAIEEGRKAWATPTSRYQLNYTGNAFDAFPQMSEESSRAYELLADWLVHGAEVWSDVVLGLDDMNMRGDQIVLAYEFCNDDFETLRRAVARRSRKMVKYVNRQYYDAAEEEAVTKNARKFGHEPTNELIKQRVAKRRKRSVLARSNHTIKSEWGRGAETGSGDD